MDGHLRGKKLTLITTRHVSQMIIFLGFNVVHCSLDFPGNLATVLGKIPQQLPRQNSLLSSLIKFQQNRIERSMKSAGNIAGKLVEKYARKGGKLP